MIAVMSSLIGEMGAYPCRFPVRNCAYNLISALPPIDQCSPRQTTPTKSSISLFPCTTMEDNNDSQSLLQSVLGIFTRKRPHESARHRSLRAQQREAWIRSESFTQHNDLDEADPESVTRTLRALEHYVQDGDGPETDSVSICIHIKPQFFGLSVP